MKTFCSMALLATALMFGACTKSEDEEATTSADTSATATLTTGNAVMNTIATSLSSLGAAAPGTLIVSTGLNLKSAASGSPYCAEHGEPLKPDSGLSKGDDIPDSARLSQDDPSYAANLFFCLATLTPEQGASVETILGSLAQAQSIICSFEEAFGDIDYTEDGTDLVADGAKTATLSETCWPSGTPDGITTIKFTKGVATALAESTGYEKNLTFTGEVDMGGEVDEVSEGLSFFNKDGIIGFKKGSTGNSPAVGDSTQVTFDTNTGAIVVNVIDDRGGSGGADSSYRRVVRMKVAGTLDDDLKFTGIDSMQGIYGNSGSNSDNLLDASSSIISMKGDSTNGFYGHVRLYNSSTGSDAYKGCTGAKTSCTSANIDDLTITDAGNTTFYRSASRSSWATHLESGLPPCDDGKDLTFAALPVTGAFGVCE